VHKHNNYWCNYDEPVCNGNAIFTGWFWCVFRHPNDWPYPYGLSHLLLCDGSSAAEVYQTVYKHLRAVGVGGSEKTFVYPEWLRELVRARFSTVGKYDAQYEGQPDVYCVTNMDLTEADWPDLAQNCEFCSFSMPSTPWVLTLMAWPQLSINACDVAVSCQLFAKYRMKKV